MYITTTGLVLRETEYKESSRMLTVLTGTEGKITVSAKGAKRRGSKTAASTQLLAYSEMTLFRGTDNRWTLTEARSLELFDGLRDELELISLASYFAEILETLSDEDTPNPGLLSLGLNSLYALSYKLKPAAVVKAAFELRIMCLAGFEPVLDGCCNCGEKALDMCFFDLVGGIVYCNKCGGVDVLAARLNAGALNAARYIVSAEPKRLFSFAVGQDALRLLSRMCEKYLLVQLDRKFKTLDFYKSL